MKGPKHSLTGVLRSPAGSLSSCIIPSCLLSSACLCPEPPSMGKCCLSQTASTLLNPKYNCKCVTNCILKGIYSQNLFQFVLAWLRNIHNHSQVFIANQILPLCMSCDHCHRRKALRNLKFLHRTSRHTGYLYILCDRVMVPPFGWSDTGKKRQEIPLLGMFPPMLQFFC